MWAKPTFKSSAHLSIGTGGSVHAGAQAEYQVSTCLQVECGLSVIRVSSIDNGAESIDVSERPALREVNPGPLSEGTFCGRPRSAINRSSACQPDGARAGLSLEHQTLACVSIDDAQELTVLQVAGWTTMKRIAHSCSA